MKKSKQKVLPRRRTQPKWLPLVLSFLIPFLGFVAVQIFNQCEPFGNKSAFLYSDEYHQYYPFFVSFRHALLSGESLLYNWQIGMGVDYLGLIAYYLGSPLNLLSVLVPESLTLELFAILVPIRLGLAGLFFAIMLQKLYGKKDIAIALFSSFYALCSWALGFQWNVMWLDTFALLPLVALGTIYLLRDKKFILYTITLFLSIAINYYIGLFTCIFVLLLFICYEICRFQGIKRFFADLLWIAVFSALAIGMTAFISLPTLAALGNTNSSNNSFPTGFRLNIVSSTNFGYTTDAWRAYKTAKASGADFLTLTKLLLTAIAYSFPPMLEGMKEILGNMGGGARFNFKEGLPNVYCGTVVMIFAIMFLTAKKVKLRDKICCVFLLIFFMVSFLLRQLDYIWHGFHFPNMIPYRFSFLYSFVVLWMGYRAWLVRNDFELWQVITAGVVSAGIIVCHGKIDGTTYWFFNILFYVLTMALLAYILIDRKRTRKEFLEADKRTLVKLVKRRNRNTALLLSVLMIGEVAANLVWFHVDFRTTSIADYPRGTTDSTSAINYMKYRERDTLFYRAEVTHTQTYNDGALNNYNGITTFTSSANVRATDFMKALGYGAARGYNRYAFEESSPVGNLFLDLKYMIERDGDVEENSYFDNVHNFNDVYLLENNAYLPLGFLAEPDLAHWDIDDGAYAFERQQKLFTLATGIEDELWYMSPDGCLSITSDDVELINADPLTGRTSYRSTNGGTITYGFTMTKKGLLCLEIDAPANNKVRVYKKINGVKTELFSDNIGLKQMISVSEVNPGDLIWAEFSVEEDENTTMDVQAGILNDEAFRKGYKVLSKSTLELTRFSNTRVSGIVECNRDGLLYTSIPYNGNWHVEVNGKPAQMVLVGNCMVSVALKEGRNLVTFRYRNNAFIAGMVVTALCLAILILTVCLYNQQSIHIGKYQQNTKPQKTASKQPKTSAEPEEPTKEEVAQPDPIADEPTQESPTEETPKTEAPEEGENN